MEDIYRSRRIILFDGFGAEVWEKGNTRDVDFGKSSVAITHKRHFFLRTISPSFNFRGPHTWIPNKSKDGKKFFIWQRAVLPAWGRATPWPQKGDWKNGGDKKGTIKSAPLFSDQCRATKALFSLPLPLFIRNFPSDELWEWERGCARSFRKRRPRFFTFLTCWLRVFLPTALLWVVSRTKQFRFLLLYFENIVESNAI